MDHRLFIDTGTTRNPEQREAQFYANIAPFLDLIFNRTPVKMPEIPEQFRAGLEELDADLQRGQIEKHFHLDHEARQIRPKTDAANNLVIFVDMVKNDPEIAAYIQQERGGEQ